MEFKADNFQTCWYVGLVEVDCISKSPVIPTSVGK